MCVCVRVMSVSPPECTDQWKEPLQRPLRQPCRAPPPPGQRLNNASVSQSAVIEGRCGRYDAKGHRAHQLSAAAQLEGAQSKDQMSRR